MTERPPDANTPKRARERAEAQKRRMDKIARRELILDLLVSGYERETIARKLGIALSTVRRDIERALDQRRSDSHERYIRLQTARLTKALRAADDAIETGDLKAIEPLLKVIGALDRYQGLALATPAPVRHARPPAPLALTHCAPSLAMSGDLTHESSEKGA
jgi:hypothetical protein